MKGRITGSLHSEVEDLETMRMASSQQFFRIEDYQPTRIVAACLRCEIDDCEAKVSSARSSQTKDYENLVQPATF